MPSRRSNFSINTTLGDSGDYTSNSFSNSYDGADAQTSFTNVSTSWAINPSSGTWFAASTDSSAGGAVADQYVFSTDTSSDLTMAGATQDLTSISSSYQTENTSSTYNSNLIETVTGALTSTSGSAQGHQTASGNNSSDISGNNVDPYNDSENYSYSGGWSTDYAASSPSVTYGGGGTFSSESTQGLQGETTSYVNSTSYPITSPGFGGPSPDTSPITTPGSGYGVGVGGGTPSPVGSPTNPGSGDGSGSDGGTTPSIQPPTPSADAASNRTILTANAATVAPDAQAGPVTHSPPSKQPRTSPTTAAPTGPGPFSVTIPARVKPVGTPSVQVSDKYAAAGSIVKSYAATLSPDGVSLDQLPTKVQSAIKVLLGGPDNMDWFQMLVQIQNIRVQYPASRSPDLLDYMITSDDLQSVVAWNARGRANHPLLWGLHDNPFFNEIETTGPTVALIGLTGATAGADASDSDPEDGVPDDAAESGSGIVGQNFGKLGTVVENPGQRITGFTDHGFTQASARGLTWDAMQSTVQQPTVVLQQSAGQYLYVSRNAAVVLNPAGQIMTAYPSSMFEPGIQALLNAAGH
jgi:hypothetical protein